MGFFRPSRAVGVDLRVDPISLPAHPNPQKYLKKPPQILKKPLDRFFFF